MPFGSVSNLLAGAATSLERFWYEEVPADHFLNERQQKTLRDPPEALTIRQYSDTDRGPKCQLAKPGGAISVLPPIAFSIQAACRVRFEFDEPCWNRLRAR